MERIRKGCRRESERVSLFEDVCVIIIFHAYVKRWLADSDREDKKRGKRENRLPRFLHIHLSLSVSIIAFAVSVTMCKPLAQLPDFKSSSENRTWRNLTEDNGRIYHKVQVELTYNSNHMEGSRLTHEQTRYIFETNTVGITEEGVRVDGFCKRLNC